jgi:hypothetical protein
MLTELTATAGVLLLLVFLSTIESAYESLSEVSLRVLSGEDESSPKRVRFFRELMEHRRRFELILILGTQLSIAAIAILLADVFIDAGVRTPLLLAFVAAFVVVILFRQLVPRLLTQNHPEDVFWVLLPVFQVFYRPFSLIVAPVTALSFATTPIATAVSSLVVAESAANRLTAFSVTADGSLTDRRSFADLGPVVPDGIAMDAHGAVWLADPLGNAVVRVADGGEVLERRPTSQGAFACELGGPDGHSLYVCTYDAAASASPNPTPVGTLEVTRVDVPAA